MNNEYDDPRQNAEMEEVLRGALARPLPLPEGFAARVAAAAHAGRRRPALRLWQRAAAAVLVLGLLGGADEGYRLARQHHAAQVAAQVTLAVEIARAALADTETDAQSQVRAALKTAQPTDARKAER